MSSSNHSVSDLSSPKSFSHLAQELKKLKLWKKQEAIIKEREKIEREAHLACLEEEIRRLKQEEIKINQKLRERKSRSRHSSSIHSTPYEQSINSLNREEYYQPPPRVNNTPPKIKEIKIDLPHFHGRDNVEAYLDWEMKVEQLFVCHQVGEERKVPLATLSFQGQAMYWWTSLDRERRLHNDPPIQYWNELRSALRRRHIPSYYHRELMDNLQRLQQKALSIEEYRQKMELYMMRIGIREEENITISRFLSGLNLEIRDKVELLPYKDLNDLVQICIKVEQQVLRKKNSTTSSYYKKETKREGNFFRNPPPPSTKKETVMGKEKEIEKGKGIFKTSDVKCFKCLGRGHIASQCPSKRTIIIRGKDTYSSQEETTTSSSESEEETHDTPSQEDTYPYEGELLMIRKLLNINKSDETHSSQRENIFHSRCNILENACSLVVDSGSCCNCCSDRMVNKLNLTTTPHPKPYKLHWLNDNGDVVVDKQVKVKFSIGNYEDQVVCDIVPMEVCHILLGRPWQFDKKIIHNGLTNEITFTHQNKTFVLQPLTPSQVEEDQRKMRHKRENERKTKKEEKKNKGKMKEVHKEETSKGEKLLKTNLLVKPPSHLLICQKNKPPKKKTSLELTSRTLQNYLLSLYVGHQEGAANSFEDKASLRGRG